MSHLSTSLQDRGNNFDLLRFIAAVLVFTEHAFPIFTGKPVKFDLCSILFNFTYGATGILMFFAISGFLVTHSLIQSKNWFQFMVKRILRILPGLSFVVIVSVLMAGIFLTHLDFITYIKHPVTLKYIQNILIFRSYYELPGVFENNLYTHSVNGSLWTIPFEFTCYILVSLILIIRYFRKPWIMTILFFILFSGYLFFEPYTASWVIPVIGISIKSLYLPLLFYLSGTCYYLWRNKLKFTPIWIVFYLLLLIPISLQFVGQEWLALILPYLLLSIAFSKYIPANGFARMGDFSYGFYLWAFPVKQTISYYFVGTWSLTMMIVTSFIITLAISIISYHLIEKPALSLKKKLPKK